MLGYGTPLPKLDAFATAAACCCMESSSDAARLVAKDEAREDACCNEDGLTLLVSRPGLLGGLLFSCFAAPVPEDAEANKELLPCCLEILSVFACPPGKLVE